MKKELKIFFLILLFSTLIFSSSVVEIGSSLFNIHHEGSNNGGNQANPICGSAFIILGFGFVFFLNHITG